MYVEYGLIEALELLEGEIGHFVLDCVLCLILGDGFVDFDEVPGLFIMWRLVGLHYLLCLFYCIVYLVIEYCKYTNVNNILMRKWLYYCFFSNEKV